MIALDSIDRPPEAAFFCWGWGGGATVESTVVYVGPTVESTVGALRAPTFRCWLRQL